jgi:branched-chain amino acid transport system permease protein
LGFFAQIAVSGLAAGSIYGLIAVGFSVTYSTTRTLNFALGMWVMLGAMLTYTFRVSWGMPLLLVMVLVVGCMWMLGIISERLTVGPFLRSGSDLWVMSTLAVGLIFIDVAELVWGHGQNRVPAYVGESPLALGNVVVMPQQVLNVVVVCTVYVGLHVFLKKNIIGKAFRAVAFDRQASGLMAINVPRIESL